LFGISLDVDHLFEQLFGRREIPFLGVHRGQIVHGFCCLPMRRPDIGVPGIDLHRPPGNLFGSGKVAREDEQVGEITQRTHQCRMICAVGIRRLEPRQP
jgi:hypothetical protein